MRYLTVVLSDGSVLELTKAQCASLMRSEATMIAHGAAPMVVSIDGAVIQ